MDTTPGRGSPGLHNCRSERPSRREALRGPASRAHRGRAAGRSAGRHPRAVQPTPRWLGVHRPAAL